MTIGKLIAVALIAAVATPVAAQRTGTRLDRSAGAVKSVKGRDAASAILVTNLFAQCLARREGKGMRKALDLPFPSAEQTKAMSGQSDQWDACLGDSDEFDTLVFPPVLKAGGAAEWFVEVDYARVDLNRFKGMTDAALEKTDYRARTVLEDLGLCVLRQAPEEIRPFLATRPTSEEEKAAFQKIAPAVGPCVMEGSKVQLNIPNLRAILAYAAYRAASKLEATGA